MKRKSSLIKCDGIIVFVALTFQSLLRVSPSPSNSQVYVLYCEVDSRVPLPFMKKSGVQNASVVANTMLQKGPGIVTREGAVVYYIISWDDPAT